MNTGFEYYSQGCTPKRPTPIAHPEAILPKYQPDVVRDIVQIINTARRPVDCSSLEGEIQSNLTRTVGAFVQRGFPVEFMLLGFPCKSPNRVTKVIGVEPDKAEEVAIEQLARFCRRVNTVYPNGAVFNIASDGQIFSEVFGVPDEVVHQYVFRLQEMILQKKAPIEVFRLQDFFPESRLCEVREHFMQDYSPSRQDMDAKIREDEASKRIYMGFKWFIEEEFPPNHGLSRSALQKQAAEKAMEAMIRNEAYGRLIAEQFPGVVRFSIHSHHSPSKYGIKNLMTGCNLKGTPWHCAIAQTRDGNSIPIRRHEAEARGYKLIHVAGRPYYFTET